MNLSGLDVILAAHAPGHRLEVKSTVTLYWTSVLTPVNVKR